MKHKKGILISLLVAFFMVLGGFIYVTNSSSSKMSELGTLNIEYQEKWRVLETNLTSYDTLVGLLTEEYKKADPTTKFDKEYTDLHVEFISAKDKATKFDDYKKIKELEAKVNEGIKKLKVDTEMTKVAYKEMDKINPQIDAQIKEYNSLVTKFNDILDSKTLALTKNNRFDKQPLLK